MEEKIADIKRKLDLYKPILIALGVVFIAATIGLIVSLCTAAATKIAIPCYIIVMSLSFVAFAILLVLFILLRKKFKELNNSIEK